MADIPKPELGTRITAERTPRRLRRNKPELVSGVVRRIDAGSLTLRTAGGDFTVDAAKVVRT